MYERGSIYIYIYIYIYKWHVCLGSYTCKEAREKESGRKDADETGEERVGRREGESKRERERESKGKRKRSTAKEPIWNRFMTR